MTNALAVVDLGATHSKVAVFSEAGDLLRVDRTETPMRDAPPYHHPSLEILERRIVETLSKAARPHDIVAIIPSHYGSSAALLAEDGLALPMMNYEQPIPDEVIEDYRRVMPPYDEIYTPLHPNALSLGAQIFWQERAWPDAFARVRHILLGPQYWAWRLSGVLATEATALGSQSHLWAPREGGLSSLVHARSWEHLFPPLRKAYDRLGPVRPELAAQTGLSPDCVVLTGAHDSNANFARFLAAGLDDFTLLSTGTWIITFNAACPLDALDPERDMVTNSDVEGRPVPCARFMGGREFAAVLDGADPDAGSLDDVSRVIERGTLALPSFAEAGGPMPGTGGRGRIVEPEPATEAARAALATLYTALMVCESLDGLRSANQIIVDGPFASNALFLSVLAGLRPGQPVRIASGEEGTATGAALLWQWTERTEPARLALGEVAKPNIAGLHVYQEHWRRAARSAPT